MLFTLLKVALVAAALVGAACAYALWRGVKRPSEDVDTHGREPRRPGERRLVCAGDSLTHATMSFDYCQALRERLGHGVRILNAGVNADLAYNLAQRLPSIVAAAPDDVVVLIGTNDLCGEQTPSVAAWQLRAKQLPEPPSFAFFERELTRVLGTLREQTRARLIVVTPPLCGEDLSHPVHARLQRYATRITQLAEAHGAYVVPFHALMERALRASGHVGRPGFTPGFTESRWMMLVPFQRYLLGMSYDQISKPRGLWGSTDLLHLNETSGRILTDAIEAALQRGP